MGWRFNEEFTIWDPPHRFAFTITASNIPLIRAAAEDIQLLDTGGRTALTYRQGFEPVPGLGWALAPIAWNNSRELRNGLRRLRHRVEAG